MARGPGWAVPESRECRRDGKEKIAQESEPIKLCLKPWTYLQVCLHETNWK